MARRAQGWKPAPPERSLAPWLWLAAAAHTALFVAAMAARQTAAPPSAPAVDAVRDPIWLDLIAGDAAEAPVAGAANDTPSQGVEPKVTNSPVEGLPREEAVPPRPLAALARESLERQTSSSRGLVPGLAPSPAADAPGEAASAEPASEGQGGAKEEGGANESGAEQAGAGKTDAAAVGSGRSAPRLSLRDLGVDRASNPFIGSVTDLPTERQRYNQRLRQSLRGEIAKQDQARGLGPEGPAVVAVTEIVMASASAPNTSALLRVRTNGAGRVTLVDVLEADRDGAEWQRIADQLVRALAGKKLRVPAGTNGVSFQLRVVSRVQLPSGADPGLAVDVLGIPLKKGEGKRSTKLSILSPSITEIEVPDSNGLRVPVVTFSLISGAGDPTDIGAVARRLVTAYLVAMDTEVLPDSVPPQAPPPATTP